MARIIFNNKETTSWMERLLAYALFDQLTREGINVVVELDDIDYTISS